MNNQKRDDKWSNPRPGTQQAESVMSFVGELEGKVRLLIESFNLVIGTRFEKSAEVAEYAREHVNFVPELVADAEVAWRIHKQLNSVKWLRQANWMIAIWCSVIGFGIGLLVRSL